MIAAKTLVGAQFSTEKNLAATKRLQNSGSGTLCLAVIALV